MMKLYYYPACSSCKKAIAFLDKKKAQYNAIDISQKAPTQAELKKMLALYDGQLKKLFNTSGKLYRELGISKKLPDMTTGEAVKLLASNGMLVKRPFLLTEKGGEVEGGKVGFKEEDWKKL